MFILKYHANLFFSQLSNMWYPEFLLSQLFVTVREFYKLQFSLTATFTDTILLSPQYWKHLNTDQYKGSEKRGEINLDSDINLLSSDKLLKLTNSIQSLLGIALALNLSFTLSWTLISFRKFTWNCIVFMCKEVSLKIELLLMLISFRA